MIKAKVYGPYTRKKDGRKHVIHYDNGVKRTQSYPRYLMELHLGRTLEAWEHVDHINEDFTDDRIENLQLLTIGENNRKSMRLRRPAKAYVFQCPVCEVQTSRDESRIRANRKQGKAGPFCSKSCAGKYQHARVAERNTQPV